MFSRFKTPITALILALLPYLLFVGSSETMTVNGVVVRDEQINFLGIICALVGLGLVFSVLRPSAPRDGARKALAIIAGLLCLLQLAAAINLVRPLDWLNPESHLPALAYRGLSEGNRNIVASMVERGDIEEIRRDLMTRSSFMLDDAHQHMDYADVCHEGRYRIDYEALAGLFAVLGESDAAEVRARAESMRRPAPQAADCSPQRTAYAMGEIVDDIAQSKDMISVLRDGYVQLAGQP